MVRETRSARHCPRNFEGFQMEQCDAIVYMLVTCYSPTQGPKASMSTKPKTLCHEIQRYSQISANATSKSTRSDRQPLFPGIRYHGESKPGSTQRADTAQHTVSEFLLTASKKNLGKSNSTVKHTTRTAQRVLCLCFS